MTSIASLTQQHEKILPKWEDSTPQQALLKIVQRKILSSETVHIKSAVCLGLGSMEKAKRGGFLGLKRARHQKDETPVVWDDCSDDEVEFPLNDEVNPRFWSAARSNVSLYQLVIFETVLKSLKEKCGPINASFSDPSFTEADMEFLRARGHSVISYSETAKQVKPCDPEILKQICESTFVFAPGLDVDVLIEAVGTGKPGLLLSIDLFDYLNSPCIFRKRLGDPLPSFEDFACASNFRATPELGLENFGFTWPLSLDSAEALQRFEFRQSRAEDLRIQREGWWDMNKERIESQRAKQAESGADRGPNERKSKR